MKRIPKAFQLGPNRITVHIVSESEMAAVCKRTGTELGDYAPLGLTHYEGNAIYVQRVGKNLPKVLQLQTFWHEYFHMLFWNIGRERLSRDETLVDNLGSMQLQMIQTAEF